MGGNDWGDMGRQMAGMVRFALVMGYTLAVVLYLAILGGIGVGGYFLLRWLAG